MLPIFSLRSILGIFLGLLIGMVAGQAYVAYSDASVRLTPGWPPVQIMRNVNPVNTRYTFR